MSPAQSFGAAPIASSRFNLPQELIDMVIDHLDDDEDDESLREVGLVSRQWYFHTRERLFHFVELQPRDTVLHFVEHVGRLQQVVAANPPLACCVKSLSVRDLSRSWFENDFSDFGNIFTDLLARFTDIFRLSIVGAEEEDTTADWGSIPKQVRNTLYTLASKPSFQDLRLEAIDGIDLRLFIRDTNIEVLEIRGCWPGIAPLIPPGSGSPTSLPSDEPWAPPSACQLEGSKDHTLRCLTIDDCGRMFCDFLRHQREQKPPTWLRTRQLVVGTVPWDDGMDEAFRNILEKSATSVEKYTVEQGFYEDLSYYRNSPPHPSPLAFHRLPNLTLLKISTLGNELSRCPSLNPLPAIISALDRISQPGDESKLEEFEIVFDFGTSEVNDVDLDASNEHSPLAHFHETVVGLQGFSELDVTLCRSTFRRLKCVVFTFDFSGCNMPEEHWRLDLVWESLFAKMKGTEKRGILTLQSFER